MTRCEKMEEWTDKIRPVFSNVSREMNIYMRYDTHYDACNYEYSQVKRNQIHRVDFQPMKNHTIQVTLLIDTYPLFPSFFRFLHREIPMFPYMAKTEYEYIAEINTSVEDGALKKCVLEHLKCLIINSERS